MEGGFCNGGVPMGGVPLGGVPSGRNPKQIWAPVSRCCNVFVYRNWMEQDSERERFLWEELLMEGIQIKSGLLLHCVCLEIGWKENSKGNNNFANKPNFNQIREHAKKTFQVNSFIEIKIKQKKINANVFCTDQSWFFWGFPLDPDFFIRLNLDPVRY